MFHCCWSMKICSNWYIFSPNLNCQSTYISKWTKIVKISMQNHDKNVQILQFSLSGHPKNFSRQKVCVMFQFFQSSIQGNADLNAVYNSSFSVIFNWHNLMWRITICFSCLNYYKQSVAYDFLKCYNYLIGLSQHGKMNLEMRHDVLYVYVYVFIPFESHHKLEPLDRIFE